MCKISLFGTCGYAEKITITEEDKKHIKWMASARDIKLPNILLGCVFCYSCLLISHDIPITGYFYRARIWSGKVGLDKKLFFPIVYSASFS